MGTGATTAVTIAQAFILIPLCLKYLGTSLYGAWLGASELLVWLQLLDLGIPNLMTQRIGASIGQNDTDGVGRWSASGMCVLAVLGAGLTLLAFAAAPLVAAWARVPAADAGAFTASFRLAAVASAFLLAYHGVLGIARGVQITGLVNAAQVLAAVTGLVVAVWLLLEGFGIWSLAFGLLARALVSGAGAALFLVRSRRTIQLRAPSLNVIRDMTGLAPSMAAANGGYLLANNTEVLLVTTFFGPVAAAIYALTRRAVDGVRALLESMAWAAYGGFAHLVTADDRHRARGVLHEVLWLRLAAACLCGAVVLGVNQAFVTLLFGPENFGGIWLTTGFVVQMIVSGQAFLANYLFRAAGAMREGSLLLAGEAVLRVAAVAAALTLGGLAAAPWAAAGISTIALLIALTWLDRDLPPARTPAASAGAAPRLAPFALVASGLVVASLPIPFSWISLGAIVVVMSVGGAALVWRLAPPAVSNGTLLRWIRS